MNANNQDWQQSGNRDLKVSIIVPTYNGGTRILYTLKSIVNQNYPESCYEILVIDNNSIDDTADVIKNFIKTNSFPNIRYILEEKQGLNFSRNRGVKEAMGDITAFIDDDATADVHWVKNLYKSYRNDNIGCVGGKSILKWPNGKRPAWLTNIFDSLYSGFDLGTEEEIELKSNFPYGTNISFRKEAVINERMFSSNLGRVGKNLIGGGETEMCMKLYQTGWKIIYNPSAIVYHHVPESRINKKWLGRRVYGRGISAVLRDDNILCGESGYKRLYKYVKTLFLNILRYGKYFHRSDCRIFYLLIMKSNMVSLGYYMNKKIREKFVIKKGI